MRLFIGTWISGPQPALDRSSAIERRVKLLAEIPFIAPVTDEPGVYELTIICYPYKVYYRVEGEEVQIVHIRHTSRRPLDMDDL